MPRTQQEYRNLFGGALAVPIWCDDPQKIQIGNINVKGILYDDGQIDYIFLAVTEQPQNTTLYSNIATPTLQTLYKDLFDPDLRRKKPEERSDTDHRLCLLDAMAMLM